MLQVKLLSSFRHEQIVLFRGACLELPNLCIITELMSGGNLYNLLHSSETLAWKLRLQYEFPPMLAMLHVHAPGGSVGRRNFVMCPHCDCLAYVDDGNHQVCVA